MGMSPPPSHSVKFGPLVEGAFVKRENRFVACVAIEGKTVTAHLANPGRMRELLLPGRHVWLTPATNPDRRTAYSLTLIEYNGTLVSLNSSLPNLLVARALKDDLFPSYRDYAHMQREVTLGHSRIDFCLSQAHKRYWLEVKSVTLVENGLARFPDAPTKRGTRHLQELIHALESSDQKSGVLFVIQRDDAQQFIPNDDTDPEFGAILRKAVQYGVEIQAAKCQITPEAIWISQPVPIIL